MLYHATVKVWGLCPVTVEADSSEEAAEIANLCAGEMDFGELSDVEWDTEQVYIENPSNVNPENIVRKSDFYE